MKKHLINITLAVALAIGLCACPPGGLTPEKDAVVAAGGTKDEQSTALKQDIINHLKNPTNQQVVKRGLILGGRIAKREFVDDPEDMKEINAQLWVISEAFHTLMTGEEITATKVEDTVNLWTDGWTDTSMNDYVDVANIAWQAVYPQLLNADEPELWRTWLLIFSEAAQAVAGMSREEVLGIQE